MPEAMPWTERMSSVFGLDVPGASASVDGEVSQASLGSVEAFRISGTPQDLRRSRRSISRADYTPLKVCAVRSGTMTLVREGHADLHFYPDDIAFYDTARPYRLRFGGQWECAVMTVNREELALSKRTLSHALSRSFSGTGPGGVLTQLLHTAMNGPAVRHESSAFLGNAAIDLLSGLAFDSDVPYAPEEALRVAVDNYIRNNLGSTELSATHIARAHGISVRTLHRIFSEEEWGVAEYIRNLRLEAVRRDLLDPRLRGRSIMSIAAPYAFRDQAHLTRIYRAKFGVTPAAHRREPNLLSGASQE